MQILLTFLPIHPKIQHNREGELPPLGKFKVQSKKYKVKSIASGQTLNPRPATLVPSLYFELFTFDLLQQVTLETEKWEGCSLGQPDIGYHYYRRVADDDPVNDQLIEFTFRQPKVNGSGAITQYIVPDPVDSNQPPIHLILPADQPLPGGLTQEGFSGKDVVLGILRNYQIPKGQHNLELKAEAESGLTSTAASVRLIIDPDPPTLELQ